MDTSGKGIPLVMILVLPIYLRKSEHIPDKVGDCQYIQEMVKDRG